MRRPPEFYKIAPICNPVWATGPSLGVTWCPSSPIGSHPPSGLASHLGRAFAPDRDRRAGRRPARRCPAPSPTSMPRRCRRSSGSTVTSVSVIDGDAGTSSRARLALTGDDVPAIGVRQDGGRDRGHPADGRARQSRRHRDPVLPPARPGAGRRAAQLYGAPFRPGHRTGSCWFWKIWRTRPRRRASSPTPCIRSIPTGPRLRRRTAGPAARDVLGPAAGARPTPDRWAGSTRRRATARRCSPDRC